MPKQLNVRISDLQFSALDDAVASGRFPSRAAALRSAIELLLTDEPAAEAEPADAASGSGSEAAVVAALAEVAEVAEAEGEVPLAVAAHPALVEQRVWTWAQERHLPAAPLERPALALARRAVIPVLSGAAGALLATVVRGGAVRRERDRGAVRAASDGPRGTLHLFVVNRRG